MSIVRFLVIALVAFPLALVPGRVDADTIPLDPVSLPGTSVVSTFATGGANTPAGLAFGPNGDLYVTDLSSGKVFVLSKNAAPRLFASGLEHPVGIAVLSDGDAVVAESTAHCLREIVNGMVKPFAGRCGEAGTVDGTSSTARFRRPLGLTTDGKRTVWVADWGNGIRKVDPSGAVTTFPDASPKNVYSVSYAHSIDGDGLFATDEGGLTRFDVGSVNVAFSIDRKRFAYPTQEGGVDAGYPWAVAALGRVDAIYTDLRRNTISYLGFTQIHTIAGPVTYDPLSSSGNADGEGDRARFFAPAAVAVDPDGSYVIADAGNHSLRRLTPVLRELVVPPSAAENQSICAMHRTKIAYLGNSYAWWDTTWPSSIEATAADSLRAAGIDACVVPFVFSATTFVPQAQFVNAFLADGGYDALVWQINTRSLLENNSTPDLPGLMATIERLHAALAARHCKLFVVIHPIPSELTTSEMLETELGTDNPLEVDHKLYDALRAALASTTTPVLDLYPTLEDAELKPPGALFGSLDAHFSGAGRNLVGKAVGSWLLPHLEAASSRYVPQTGR